MAKPTKTAGTTPGATGSTESDQKTKAVAPIQGGVDISKLTPEQLLNLQKQLKARKAEKGGDKKERFALIDSMLQEKDETSGEFKYTTRDILNNLRKQNLSDPASEDSEEIKKIQARKQHLEKKTDEKGQLVHAAGTFGYKQASTGFIMTPERIANWFTAENVAKLSAAQKQAVAKACS